MTAQEFRDALDSHASTPERDVAESPLTKMMDNSSKKVVMPRTKKSDMLVVILSAMYAKLLVVMGIAFPLAQVISPLIQQQQSYQQSFQELDRFTTPGPNALNRQGFHLFLYVVSIAFLVYAYVFLMRGRQPAIFAAFSRLLGGRSQVNVAKTPLGKLELKLHAESRLQHARNCGSFYLRVGAVAFSIGSMIYTGLEIVQFFELDPNSECYNILSFINPLSHMAFTFIQLYFIFLNAKMCIYKYQKVARFGLMHLVATNLCVWLLAVIQESKHEIVAHTHLGPASASSSSSPSFSSIPWPTTSSVTTNATHLSSVNATNNNHNNNSSFVNGLFINVTSNEASFHRNTTLLPAINREELACRRSHIIGKLVQKASPFLFPCTIEYSLICAAICYIMWKNIGKPMRRQSDPPNVGRRQHHYRVDCSNAIKGLFTGILVLVLAIITVIVFFVLIHNPEFHDLALMESHVSELILFLLTSIAPLLAMYRIRHFRYSRHRNVELDNILLILAQTGVYLFSIFSIISGYFKQTINTTVVLLSAFARLVQATVQTVFVLDASQRNASTAEQAQKKPGREIITFLLVCNFAMWIINTLKTGRTESSPVQLDFYGFWGWTIVARVSTPLAIFFRFHSTVCLCEIWKKLYKQKNDLLAAQV